MSQQYLRPTRVKWLFPAESLQFSDPLEWITCIPSKSVRAIARRLDVVLEQAGLTYTVEPVTEDTYADWHRFYAEKMRAQNHEVMAKADWFGVRMPEVSEILLVEIRNLADQQRVGAAIIMRKHDGEWNKPYRASERISLNKEKNLSVGALLDLLSLRHIFAHQPTLVKSGASRNAFGHTNTLGYLTYKLKIGYEPWLFPEFKLEDEYPQITPETPTAWFVVPAEATGTLVRMHKLIVSPDMGVLADELRRYLEQREVETLLR